MRGSKLFLLFLVMASCGEREPEVKTVLQVVEKAGPNKITLEPGYAVVMPGTEIAFTALDATGETVTGGEWRVEEGEAGGAITQRGKYKAPEKGGTYHVGYSLEGAKSRAVVFVSETSKLVIVYPQSVSLPPGGMQTFAAVGFELDPVVWSVSEGVGGGKVDEHGRYKAPATAGTYHVRVSSVISPAVLGEATIVVDPRLGPPVHVSVSISPTALDMVTTTTHQFTADVTGSTNRNVLWSVDGLGAIDSEGLYSAPTTPGTYFVKAVSGADPTKEALAVVRVIDFPAVRILPYVSSVTEFELVRFYAYTQGLPTTDVTWKVLEQDGGRITSQGEYTPPATAGTYTVLAFSDWAPTVWGSARIAVRNSLATSDFEFVGAIAPYGITSDTTITLRLIGSRSAEVSISQSATCSDSFAPYSERVTSTHPTGSYSGERWFCVRFRTSEGLIKDVAKSITVDIDPPTWGGPALTVNNGVTTVTSAAFPIDVNAIGATELCAWTFESCLWHWADPLMYALPLDVAPGWNTVSVQARDYALNYSTVVTSSVWFKP